MGLDTPHACMWLILSLCMTCPGRVLDPLGHHALTCKRGGARCSNPSQHTARHRTCAETCHRAHLNVKVEAGNKLTHACRHDKSYTRPLKIYGYASCRRHVCDVTACEELYRFPVTSCTWGPMDYRKYHCDVLYRFEVNSF